MLNSVSGVSANINLRTNSKINTRDIRINTPITEPQCDTVCFKGGVKKTSLIKLCTGGAGLAAFANLLPSFFKIEQGRKDFKEMDTYYWIQKYKNNPKVFEKLLLEDDEYKGEIGKRLCFAHDLNVIRAFYKDTEALNRIFSRENILNIERNSNAGFDSVIKDLQIDCKDFIDGKMFEKDEDGKILLHIFTDEYKSSDKFDSPFLHINKAYDNQPDKLVEMYLTKDSNGKYPLEYLKDKPKEEQESALKTVKQTFMYEPELYKQILATYDSDYLAKEKEIQEKINVIMKNGWEFVDEEGNRVIAKIKDRNIAARFVNGEIDKPPYGYNNFEKYNDKNQLIEESRGDDFSTNSTKYFYENGVCNKKIRTVSSKYNSSTETITLVDGIWKSDREDGWADW